MEFIQSFRTLEALDYPEGMSVSGGMTEWTKYYNALLIAVLWDHYNEESIVESLQREED